MRRLFQITVFFVFLTLFNAGAAWSMTSIITHGPRNDQAVALTFDACPAHDMKVDEGILKVLIKTKTHATFFLSGRWMESFPQATRALAHVPGFELALHGFTHPHMTRLSEAAIEDQLQRNKDELRQLTGLDATHFRPPYGEFNATVLQASRAEGLEPIEYDLASGDPSKAFRKERLVRYVTRLARNGSIIVMHVNGRGWHTAEALPDIIQTLEKKGFRLVTVSELLGEVRHP